MKKYKTLWKIIFSIIILLLVSGGWYMNYNWRMHNLEESLRSYLINEKGINSNEIVSLDARISKIPKYPVVVRLKDDPQEYIYTDRGGQGWMQVNPDPN
ncbi:DUF3139 domain-containing protein [Paenibacillus pabuli]|uniref:DUF3139 domain-containing protein n=1 Tax=Paenibacillus pabuli TaxID=1472 RepID=UPI00345752C0